jgi:alkylated DNA repair dioxygenase AlkB
MAAPATLDRYALTLGEQSEIHVGCQIHGSGLAKEGFTVRELEKVRDTMGASARLVMLSDLLPMEKRTENEAAVLHIKDGIRLLMEDATYADRMLTEQRAVEYDKFYFDRRRRRKLQKRARHNAVFGDAHVTASEDYKQSTVIAFGEVPLFEKLRLRLPEFMGAKAKLLQAEGNHYHHEKAGIGWHGDSERNIVISCSLGRSTVLRFHWRSPGCSEVSSAITDFKIDHGDIYIMSEKTTGHDWRMRSRYRLVHAAGAKQYVEPKVKVDKKRKREE